jgi:uncharacterized RDD family membrane protein YckC
MDVSELAPHERLRRARLARAEELGTIARRIGVREHLLRAIEDGRFADLPRGVYARAAIRSYAVGLGLPPGEILTDCEPLLPVADDVITALCRLRGIRPPSSGKPTVKAPDVTILGCPTWRLAAAAALDALVVAAMLLAVVAGTVTVSGVPVSALGHGAAPAFGAMGVVLWACYAVLFGGIAGATVGERIVGLQPGSRDARPADLRLVAARALQCACRDVSFIELLGGWLGTLTAGDRALPPGRPTLARTDTRPC